MCSLVKAFCKSSASLWSASNWVLQSIASIIDKGGEELSAGVEDGGSSLSEEGTGTGDDELGRYRLDGVGVAGAGDEES